MFEKTRSIWQRLVRRPGSSPDLQAQGTTAIQEDRRLWARYSADLDATVEVNDRRGVQRARARVRDISLGGANLVFDRQLPTGQLLTLEWPARGDEVRTTLACVVRVDPLPDGKWSIGCVFSRELTADDLGALGARRLENQDDDQRTWKRFTTQSQAKYQLVGDDAEETHTAQVLNLSASGIGLLLEQPVEAGSLLSLDLLDRKGRVVRSILGCVVHTTKRASGELAVGCNFIRELAEDELEALL